MAFRFWGLAIACAFACGEQPPNTPAADPAGAHSPKIAGLDPTAAAPNTDAETSPAPQLSADSTLPESTSMDKPATTANASHRNEGKVVAGDSLSRILGRHGAHAGQIHAIQAAMADKGNPHALQIGEGYVVELDQQGKIEGFQLERGRSKRFVVRRDQQGSYSADLEEFTKHSKVVQVSGRIQSSLFASVARSGEGAALAERLADVFAYDIDFLTEVRKGDRWAVTVERIELESGDFLGYGKLLAAAYEGQVAKKRGFLYEGNRATPHFVDAEGYSLEKTLLKTPLAFTRISSKFNRKRMHPVLHKIKGHNGVDYAAPTGTPVRAAARGRIRFRGRKGGAGNLVVIAHEGKMKTLYMHLSKFARGQKVGQWVDEKTIIGYVGQTGLATGPHLHFGVKINGRYVDPLGVNRQLTRPRRLAKAARSRFQSTIVRRNRELQAALDAQAPLAAEPPSQPKDEVGTMTPLPAAILSR